MQSAILVPLAMAQVHQARLLMELEAGAGEGGDTKPLAGPGGLLGQAATLWGATVRRVHISEFHSDVAAHLRIMGVPCVKFGNASSARSHCFPGCCSAIRASATNTHIFLTCLNKPHVQQCMSTMVIH